MITNKKVETINSSGFTLIEIMISLAIFSIILLALLSQSFFEYSSLERFKLISVRSEIIKRLLTINSAAILKSTIADSYNSVLQACTTATPPIAANATAVPPIVAVPGVGGVDGTLCKAWTKYPLKVTMIANSNIDAIGGPPGNPVVFDTNGTPCTLNASGNYESDCVIQVITEFSTQCPIVGAMSPAPPQSCIGYSPNFIEIFYTIMPYPTNNTSLSRFGLYNVPIGTSSGSFIVPL